MDINGEMIIGNTLVRGNGRVLRAFNPTTNSEIAFPEFSAAEVDLVHRACELADKAFDTFRHAPPDVRASFLEAIANGIAELGDALIERAHQETGLPVARLQGERARTCAQLRLFARIVREGRWLNATIDSAIPDRTPQPRSDLRMQLIPVGPVAVFGASNFPLAFSVAGGDTASALAAGCPVIVKAHRGHPGTAEFVGRAIRQAVLDCGLPDGTFSLILGEGSTVGTALVSHPAIKAVGFTGSRSGGMALVRTAAQRDEPIPVYAEMSSINPVFLLPGACASRGSAIARGFVDSLVLGAGQFCTNPGLIVALEGPNLEKFIGGACENLAEKPSQTMLTPGIHAALTEGIKRLKHQPAVAQIGSGLAENGPNQARGALFVTDFETLLANEVLRDEVFGPVATVVRCRSEAEMLRVADSLEGQLTASLHLDRENSSDMALARKLVPILERKAGRVLANGYPTGVEVSYAMIHGGPFPATSNSRVTSVGATAIERFLRPVCYQDMPQDLLPDALKDGNPLSIDRLRDGAPSIA
jgi:2,5-dioxopentanoate dehydrogenase